MHHSVLVYGSGGALKSVPLQALPREAWMALGGDEGDSSGIQALYETIPWLYRGINAIAFAAAGMPHRVHRGGEDGAEVAEARLPFEIEGGLTALIDHFARMVTMYGAAYALAEKNAVRRVKNVRRLHPNTMRPLYDSDRGLVGFERRLGGQAIRYAVEEVAYTWMPNVKTEIGPGIAPAQAAAAAAGVLAHIDKLAGNHFKNGAISPTLIELNENTSPADQERMESWARRMLAGVRNAFSIKTVAGGMKVHPLGNQLKDLAVPELTAAKREDIATALGVPQTLLFSNAANYATAAQDDLHFYDKTVRPLDKLIVDALNRIIFVPLGYYLQTHHGEMEIYQRQEMAKAYGMAQLFTVGAIPVEYLWDAMAMPETYRVGGRYYRRQSNAEKLPKPEEEERDQLVTLDTSEADALRQWQRLALARIREGKPAKALRFESAAIPASKMAAIRGAVRAASGAAQVQRIFAEALRWAGYP